jgi:hypothetical protein
MQNQTVSRIAQAVGESFTSNAHADELFPQHIHLKLTYSECKENKGKMHKEPYTKVGKHYMK